MSHRAWPGWKVVAGSDPRARTSRRGRELQALFKELDLLHYHGAIGTLYTVEMRPLAGGDLGWCCYGAKRIVIDSHYGRLPFGHDRETGLRATLLHEMSHAIIELRRRTRVGCNDHGYRFIAELRRLVRAGESCLKPHINVLRNGWGY